MNKTLSNFFDHSFEHFESLSLKPVHIQTLMNEIYKNFSPIDEKMISKIGVEHYNYFKNNFTFNLPQISKVESSSDGTYKFLMKMEDGQSVETVLINFRKKYTVCLSSQVGCAMGCKFCYTATQGYIRNLSPSEILGQYIKAYQFILENNLKKKAMPNIVFMGQGEPLKNFDSVKKALHIFTDKRAFHLGPRQITLSTVGYLPSIKRFNELPPINLALSLHSPFNQQRTELIPVGIQYDLESILSSLDKVKLLHKQFITYEYLIIKNLNHSKEHAKKLADILGKKRALINLIAFNPFPGSLYQRPSLEDVESFKNELVKYGLRVMIRITKGEEILAACGQLKS